jgi:hypothetical protein
VTRLVEREADPVGRVGEEGTAGRPNGAAARGVSARR